MPDATDQSGATPGGGLTPEELQVLLMERVERVHSYVSRRIPARCRGAIDPDDVLQEVWISAFHVVSSFRATAPDAFDRWLTTIVRSKLVNAVRRVRRAKRGGGIQEGQDPIDRTSSFAGLAGLVDVRARTPSSEQAMQDAVRAVESALGGLPEEYEKVIRLRFLEGRSQDEVAEAMHKSPQAIHSLLYRGLLKLRQRLGQPGQYFSDADSSAGQP